MLSFKPTFSLSSFTFIKRLFGSSLSAIRMVSFAYLSLLIFLLAMLIPACASSSPAFLMMYSACKSLDHTSNSTEFNFAWIFSITDITEMKKLSRRGHTCTNLTVVELSIREEIL